MLTELDAVAEEEAPEEEAAAATAAVPLALAAAVLPTPRRTRAAEPAVAPAAPAPAFEDALAEAAAAPVPGLVGLEVADVDAARIERLTAPAAGEAPAAAAHGALHGSVLAPSTWKQAVAVLRERTVRR